MEPTPRIISVDDHVLEPPDLFEGRLPEKYREIGPRVVRRRLRFVGGTKGREWVEDLEGGEWCDAWQYEDKVVPLNQTIAAVGLDTVDFKLTTYEAVDPGCWKQPARLAHMDQNWVDAAFCFPNVFRFAGQALSEMEDKDLSLHCVRAYNDWVMEDWSAGDGAGHLLPVTIVPLWDAEEAGKEIRRCAEGGSFFVTFPENPYPLGFPSFWKPERYWDPVFAACEETGTILCMHIGSSSRLPLTSPDAPFILSSAQTFVNTMGSLLDLTLSGVFERFGNLKVSYSEGQAGWYPYLIDRADTLWGERGDNEFGSSLPRPPSEYIADRVYFCIFDDPVALRNRDLIGFEQITFETDYPHPDSTFPNTRAVFEKICDESGLSGEERYMLARGNAIRGFDLGRYGLGS